MTKCDECLTKLTGECEGANEPEGLKILRNLLGVAPRDVNFDCEDYVPRKGTMSEGYKYSVDVLPGESEESIYGEEPSPE